MFLSRLTLFEKLWNGGEIVYIFFKHLWEEGANLLIQGLLPMFKLLLCAAFYVNYISRSFMIMEIVLNLQCLLQHFSLRFVEEAHWTAGC